MKTSSFIRLGCGIDISKDKSHLFFGAYTEDGKIKTISSKAIKMSPSAIAGGVRWIIEKRHKVDPQGQLPFQIVLESTSRYHEALLYALYEAELPVCLPQGRLLKKYVASLPWNSKNDPLDAKGLAHFACCRHTPLWAPYSKSTLELRDLLRARKSLKEKKVALKNQLHALSYAKFTSREIERSYKRLVKHLIREIKKIEKTILELYEQDDKLVAKVQPILKDVKGLGFITVLTVAVETNGFTNVNSAKELAKYAGYDIVENQSGKYSGKTRISKRGNKHIRVAMYMAALSHIRHGTGNIVNAYERARARKPEIYKHGNVVVQRKLLVLIYTLWTTGAVYDPFHVPEQCQPKAFSPSTAKSTPEQSSEVHGIATSKEALPIEA